MTIPDRWKIPLAWMPACQMKGIVAHWSAGGHIVTDTDKEHYHIIWAGDGTMVRGDHEISDNVNTADDDYAAHTRGANTMRIGVSMACMADAVESPFNAGRFPMTREQFDGMCCGIAQLAQRYTITVTRRTILSHAEVQGTLGIRQRGKWDFSRLPFEPSLKGATVCGDYMREKVKEWIAAL